MGARCETGTRDRDALLAFMASGNGNSLLNATWLPGTDPCADGWEGVACTGAEVTGLNLFGYNTQFAGLTGDVGSLGPLGSLVTLQLGYTAVGGDVASLSALARLTDLSLQSTAVTGDVAGLAPLTQLTHLGLQSTGVMGWPLSLPGGCSFDGPTDTSC